MNASDLRTAMAAIAAKMKQERQYLIELAQRNGDGDLAVMSIEAYEALARRAQLVQELERGHADVEAGRTMSAAEVIRRLHEEF